MLQSQSGETPAHGTEGKTYFGRTIFRFFADSLSGANGGTAPEAFPTETSVPLRLSISKLLSNLVCSQPLAWEEERFTTHVSFPTPSKAASTPFPSVISITRLTVSSFLYRMT
jgi:hypothetical protein